MLNLHKNISEASLHNVCLYSLLQIRAAYFSSLSTEITQAQQSSLSWGRCLFQMISSSKNWVSDVQLASGIKENITDVRLQSWKFTILATENVLLKVERMSPNITGADEGVAV